MIELSSNIALDALQQWILDKWPELSTNRDHDNILIYRKDMYNPTGTRWILMIYMNDQGGYKVEQRLSISERSIELDPCNPKFFEALSKLVESSIADDRAYWAAKHTHRCAWSEP